MTQFCPFSILYHIISGSFVQFTSGLFIKNFNLYLDNCKAATVDVNHLQLNVYVNKYEFDSVFNQKQTSTYLY